MAGVFPRPTFLNCGELSTLPTPPKPPMLAGDREKGEGADRRPGPFLRAWDSIWRGFPRRRGRTVEHPAARSPQPNRHLCPTPDIFPTVPAQLVTTALGA